MRVRDLAYGCCLAVGGCAGMFGAFYAYFLATESPSSWLTKTRLR